MPRIIAHAGWRRESGNGSDGVCVCVCACVRTCASLAGDSDALNVKERARQLQQLLLRSEMHAPRLTGTYGRGLVIRGDPISGPVCAIGNYYTNDLSLLRSTYTHIVRVCTRGTRVHARARVTQEQLPVSLRASLSHALPALPLSTRSFYSPFRGFSFLLFLLLPRRPPLCNFSTDGAAFRIREGRASCDQFISLK